MSFALAVFVVIGFAGILSSLNLPMYAREAAQRGQECTEILGDDSLDDRDKEDALQAQSRRLFTLLGILTGGSLLALALPLGVVWLLEAVGVASFSGTLGMLERIDFLAGTVIVGTLGYVLAQFFRR